MHLIHIRHGYCIPLEISLHGVCKQKNQNCCNVGSGWIYSIESNVYSQKEKVAHQISYFISIVLLAI